MCLRCPWIRLKNFTLLTKKNISFGQSKSNQSKFPLTRDSNASKTSKLDFLHTTNQMLKFLLSVGRMDVPWRNSRWGWAPSHMRGLQDFRFCSLIERLTALQRLTPAAATGHRGALAAQVGLAAKTRIWTIWHWFWLDCRSSSSHLVIKLPANSWISVVLGSSPGPCTAGPSEGTRFLAGVFESELKGSPLQ